MNKKSDVSTVVTPLFGYAAGEVIKTKLAQKVYASTVVPLTVLAATKSPKLAAAAFKYRELVEAAMAGTFNINEYKMEASRPKAAATPKGIAPAPARG